MPFSGARSRAEQHSARNHALKSHRSRRATRVRCNGVFGGWHPTIDSRQHMPTTSAWYHTARPPIRLNYTPHTITRCITGAERNHNPHDQTCARRAASTTSTRTTPSTTSSPHHGHSNHRSITGRCTTSTDTTRNQVGVGQTSQKRPADHIPQQPNGMPLSCAAPIDRESSGAGIRFQNAPDLVDAKRRQLQRLVGRRLVVADINHVFHTTVVQIVGDRALRHSVRNIRRCKAVSDALYTDRVDEAD
jgi:hypothetical protein